MEAQETPVYYTGGKEEIFFRKRHTATASFAIGLLFFLLPFAELRCGSVTLMSNTGIGMAVGLEWKIAAGGNAFIDKLKSKATDDKTQQALQDRPNIFLLVAIAAALFGLCVVFFPQRWKNIAGMCAGILCCIMLLAVMIQLGMLIKSSLAEAADKTDTDIGMNRLIKMKFTIWYYLSFAAFAAAAFFNYKHHTIEMKDEMARTTTFEFQQQPQNPAG